MKARVRRVNATLPRSRLTASLAGFFDLSQTTVFGRGYDSPTDIALSGSISDLAENGFVR